mgnify:CR=1 FL=1
MRFLKLFLIAGFVGFATPVHAVDSDWAVQDYVQARLVMGVDTIGDADEVKGGLELRLADGWHAYWRMPGDSGLPPVLNWDRSDNVESVTVEWPTPMRFETLDMFGFGYKDQVLMPLRVAVTDPTQDTLLALDADIMVCEEICVPQKVSTSVLIPAGDAAVSVNSARLDRAFDRLAAKENNEALRIENIVIGPEAVVVNAYSRRGFDNIDVFVESGDLYITAIPEITLNKDDDKRAMIRIAGPENIANLMEELSGVEVRVTIVAGRDALEQAVTY